MSRRFAAILVLASLAILSETLGQHRPGLTDRIRALGIPVEVSIYVDVAAAGPDLYARLSTSGDGGFVLAGVDFALSRWIRVGAELRYRPTGRVTANRT